jgi:hypothetical protein
MGPRRLPRRAPPRAPQGHAKGTVKEWFSGAKGSSTGESGEWVPSRLALNHFAVAWFLQSLGSGEALRACALASLSG